MNTAMATGTGASNKRGTGMTSEEGGEANKRTTERTTTRLQGPQDCVGEERGSLSVFTDVETSGKCDERREARRWTVVCCYDVRLCEIGNWRSGDVSICGRKTLIFGVVATITKGRSHSLSPLYTARVERRQQEPKCVVCDTAARHNLFEEHRR